MMSCQVGHLDAQITVSRGLNDIQFRTHWSSHVRCQANRRIAQKFDIVAIS